MDKSDIHLKINMKCMFALGAFSMEFNNYALNKVYRAYSYFIKFYFISFVTCQYIEVITILDEDLFKIAANLSISLLYSTTIWKMFICNSQLVQKLVKQIQEIEKKILSYKNKDLDDIYYQYVNWNHNISTSFIWIGVITVIPFYINPLLMQISHEPIYENITKHNFTMEYHIRPLPLSSWFPINRYKYYYLCYGYHVVAAMIGASMTVSTDLFFVSLMVFIIGQLKILQYSFKNAEKLARSLQINTRFSDTNALNYTLKHCVKMHKIIIRYVSDLDNAMRSLMLVDFVIASMQIAMVALQMVMSGFGWQQMCAMEFLLAMFIQLFLFYWHANEIMIQSGEIASAVWSSDWFHYDEKLKKCLTLVILRSQKPLTLSVGPFYHMSTQTALSIIRASYSYVAIIRQMYIRKS